jgi:hypothetical protein
MPTFPLLVKHAALDEHNARLIARIAKDTNTAPVPNSGKTLSRLGDEQQLRGIPAIGHGVQGAIPGTRP